ncbi:DUF6364 family protein [Algoriphagus taiwanensis]|uniref:Uncharacterized protein n=1 Tax=Algoriphagus taiwanensis TaxID=1445656 RepID=A0ABQ6Q3X1_9BACT|nr:hypothetical protein Ataiwa_31440 [Algoriphagus taiwanensis]
MTTKLILDINDKLAEKAKKYAEKRGESLSTVIESLLNQIPDSTESMEKKPKIKNPTLVKKILEGKEPLASGLENLVGILKDMTDEEVENVRWEYLKEKHGL